MSKILQEYNEEDIKQSYKNRSAIKFIGLVLMVVLFGIYVGNMLFGKSSLDVLLNLQADRDELKKSVLQLKKENAILQKEYFELKQLDPDS